MPPKMRRHTCSDFWTCSRSSARTLVASTPLRTSACICWMSGSIGAQGVVHIVRHTARQVGHRVLALGGHHAGAQRFGAVQVLNRDRGLRPEVLDQLRVEAVSADRVACGDLQHARPGCRA